MCVISIMICVSSTTVVFFCAVFGGTLVVVLVACAVAHVCRPSKRALLEREASLSHITYPPPTAREPLLLSSVSSLPRRPTEPPPLPPLVESNHKSAQRSLKYVNSIL